ncbi:uncharacterized protein [Prorops nasuta]|uniref:uncharacterized protein n=1 Tax=Prorops nasuta TaxID=863751 RepID=UPI0034CF0C13
MRQQPMPRANEIAAGVGSSSNLGSGSVGRSFYYQIRKNSKKVRYNICILNIIYIAMSISCDSEIFMSIPDIKIIETPASFKALSVVNIVLFFKTSNENNKARNKPCGFHLSKSKWDPYPWVGFVESGSIADIAGLKSGDCLLSIDGNDLLGLKIKDVASIIRSKEGSVSLNVWRNVDKLENEENSGLALKGPLPDVAAKLANVLSGTVRALECPICLESAAPPVSQCVHGHILCVECRPKTSRCPVCRVRLGQGRCLLADTFHRVLQEGFKINNHSKTSPSGNSSLRERLFGQSKKSRVLTAKNNRAASKPRPSLLTRLMVNGVDKAASAENLSFSNELTIRREKFDFNQQLSDRLRLKSASMGELSAEGQCRSNNDENLQAMNPRIDASSTTSISSSTPGTPLWCGSADSVTTLQLCCPLSARFGCSETITSATLQDHINSMHKGPQIHFHHGNAKIIIPSPFGTETIYLIHQGEELFFIEYKESKIWVIGVTSNNCIYEWCLRGTGENAMDIKLYRTVASLDEVTTLSPKHIAVLPNELLSVQVEIQLLEYQLQDILNV